MHRVLWVGGALVIPGLLFLFCTPRLKEALGAEAFGVFALIYTTFQVASMLDFGATKTLTYYVAGGGGRGRFWHVAGYVSAVAVIGFAVLWPVLFLLSRSSTWREALPEPAALAASTALYAGCQLCKSAYDAAGRFDLGFVSRILLAGIVVALPAALPPGFGLSRLVEVVYPAALLGLLLLNGLGLAAALSSSGTEGNPASESPTLDSLSRYQLFAFLAAVMIVASNYGERLLLSSYVPLTALGNYIVTSELLLKILLPSTIFSTILMIDLRNPAYTGHDATILRRVLAHCVITTGGLCLAIYVFSDVILYTWLKTEVRWGDTYFIAMIGGVFLNAIAALLSTHLEARGRQGLRFKIFAIYVPVHLGAVAWLVSSWGVEGAAMGWLVKGTLEVLFFGAATRRLVQTVK